MSKDVCSPRVAERCAVGEPSAATNGCELALSIPTTQVLITVIYCPHSDNQPNPTLMGHGFIR